MAALTRKGVIVQVKRLNPIATWTHSALSQVWNDVMPSLGDPDWLPRGYLSLIGVVKELDDLDDLQHP